MLGIITYSIIEGSITIYKFTNGTLVDDLNINYLTMIIYCILMVGSCLAITSIYTHYNKKLDTPSEIIKLEIISSIYDGLVTLFATISLLVFTYVPFLEPIQPIGDSIVVIILSCFYMIIPIKEIINQLKILTDKRQNQDIEKQIKKFVYEEFTNFKIYDVYVSYSGDICSIYICLYPINDFKTSEIREEFIEIRQKLYDKYKNPKVMLLLSQQKLHNM